MRPYRWATTPELVACHERGCSRRSEIGTPVARQAVTRSRTAAMPWPTPMHIVTSA